MAQLRVQIGHGVHSHLRAIGTITLTLLMDSNSVTPDELAHSQGAHLIEK